MCPLRFVMVVGACVKIERKKEPHMSISRDPLIVNRNVGWDMATPRDVGS